MATASDQPDTVQEPTTETEIGLDENVAAALSYVLGFLTGIILYLVESENEHVRFHAAQSMVVFGGIAVLSIAMSFIQVIVGFGNIVGFIFGAILSIVSLVIWLGAFIVWVYLLVRTYQGSDPRLPVAAGIADGFV